MALCDRARCTKNVFLCEHCSCSLFTRIHENDKKCCIIHAKPATLANRMIRNTILMQFCNFEECNLFQNATVM